MKLAFPSQLTKNGIRSDAGRVSSTQAGSSRPDVRSVVKVSRTVFPADVADVRRGVGAIPAGFITSRRQGGHVELFLSRGVNGVSQIVAVFPSSSTPRTAPDINNGENPYLIQALLR